MLLQVDFGSNLGQIINHDVVLNESTNLKMILKNALPGPLTDTVALDSSPGFVKEVRLLRESAMPSSNHADLREFEYKISFFVDLEPYSHLALVQEQNLLNLTHFLQNVSACVLKPWIKVPENQRHEVTVLGIVPSVVFWVAALLKSLVIVPLLVAPVDAVCENRLVQLPDVEEALEFDDEVIEQELVVDVVLSLRGQLVE